MLVANWVRAEPPFNNRRRPLLPGHTPSEFVKGVYFGTEDYDERVWPL